MLKFREIYPTGNQRNRALFTWHKNKISAPSQTVATARIAPKICQGQPPTSGSQISKFHPNRFTFGGIIVGVFPWFVRGYASLRANKNYISVNVYGDVVKITAREGVSHPRQLTTVAIEQTMTKMKQAVDGMDSPGWFTTRPPLHYHYNWLTTSFRLSSHYFTVVKTQVLQLRTLKHVLMRQ